MVVLNKLQLHYYFYSTVHYVMHDVGGDGSCGIQEVRIQSDIGVKAHD